VTFKLLGKAFVVLTLVAIFLFLGLWQLDAANKLQAAKKVTPDTTIYQLSDLASPAMALDSRSVGKKVSLRGNYILTFRAPNQIDKQGVTSDWEVALMQVDQSSAVLVLRGYWKDRLTSPGVAMSSDGVSTGVDLQAIVQPRQFEDVSTNSPGVISRVDSSVIVAETDLDLFDGFLLATGEQVSEGVIDRDRITLAPVESKATGYYWQHISYVIIWWLMAAIVIYLPFYRKRQESDTLSV
jgi:cytochrome oxidase assembly protein ShyY1